MARSDQYIGLTDDARIFLKSLQNDKNFKYEQSEVDLCDCAFYDGKITGIKVTLSSLDKNDVNLKTEYIETIQDIPWSSGPMYFTHLKWVLYKRKDPDTPIELDYLYSWHVDPMLKKHYTEIDYKKGSYYI